MWITFLPSASFQKGEISWCKWVVIVTWFVCSAVLGRLPLYEGIMTILLISKDLDTPTRCF